MSRKLRQKNDGSFPLKLGLFACTACAVVVMLSICFNDGVADQLASELDFYGIKIEKASFQTKHGQRGLYAKAPVNKDETIFHIPRFLCITHEDATQGEAGSLFKRFSADVDRKLESIGSPSSFKGILLFTFHIALEKRNLLSSLQTWFSSIPVLNRSTGGALFWEEDDLKCLDSATLWEANAVRTGLVSAIAVAKMLCDMEECPEGPFSEEELRWALAVYFHFNVRDQAIIPFVTFAKFTAKDFGIDVRMNRKSGGLDVVSKDNFAAGNELGMYYPRGPGGQLVARGVFDPSSLGIDARIDVHKSLSSSTGKRICGDHAHELMFGSNGRPRAALLKCYAWLVGDQQQRKHIDSFSGDANLVKRVYSDLMGVARQGLHQIPGACTSTNSVLRERIDALNDFTRRVLSLNLGHLRDELERL